MHVLAGVAIGLVFALVRRDRDALTGLPTRRAIRTWLALHWGPVSAVFADLDGLKAINDAHGHAAGDAAIVALAHCCRRSVRRADLVVRVGGDEFLILAHGQSGQEIAARLKAACRAAGVSASVGVAGGDRRRIIATVAEADRQMYQAKRSVHMAQVVGR